MSCQCAKCLQFCRDDISENGVHTYSCDVCKWEAPYVMVVKDFGVFPEKEFEEWAYLQWQKGRTYYKDG